MVDSSPVLSRLTLVYGRTATRADCSHVMLKTVLRASARDVAEASGECLLGGAGV